MSTSTKSKSKSEIVVNLKGVPLAEALASAPAETPAPAEAETPAPAPAPAEAEAEAPASIKAKAFFATYQAVRRDFLSLASRKGLRGDKVGTTDAVFTREMLKECKGNKGETTLILLYDLLQKAALAKSDGEATMTVLAKYLA